MLLYKKMLLMTFGTTLVCTVIFRRILIKVRMLSSGILSVINRTRLISQCHMYVEAEKST